MAFLFNIFIFVAVVAAVVLIHSLFAGHKGQVSARLSEIQKMKGQEEEEEIEDELARPFTERLLRPFFQKMGTTLGNLTPKEIRGNIEKKITYAGTPFNMTFNTFVTLQALTAIGLFSFFLLLFTLLSLPGGRAVFLPFLLGLMGLLVPWILLNSKAQKRQEDIQKTLPDMLDLILVSVEAGLGFDMALKRVVERTEGPLSREIARGLEEMRMGKTREEALRGIVRRTGVADLSSFISAIIQAEQMGTNIANTLRVQANTMRQKRRQRAEQEAAKAPIKMLFPLVFFIFPTMFIVILGPAMIQIFETLAGGLF